MEVNSQQGNLPSQLTNIVNFILYVDDTFIIAENKTTFKEDYSRQASNSARNIGWKYLRKKQSDGVYWVSASQVKNGGERWTSGAKSSNTTYEYVVPILIHGCETRVDIK